MSTKTVKLTQGQVNLVLHALALDIKSQLTMPKPNYEIVGKLTELKHEIERGESSETTIWQN